MSAPQSCKKRWFEKTAPFFIFGAFFVAIFSSFMVGTSVHASTSPAIITYQGKLLQSGLAATTTKNIIFNLYDSSSGGILLYTAAGTLGTPATVSVLPVNGIFTINLGDTGTNTLAPSIFQNNTSLFLEVTVNGETLTPRKQITASPFSFNSKYLDGVAATSTPSSSTYIPISDSSGNFNLNKVTSTGIVATGSSVLATTTISSSTINQLNAGNAVITSITSTNFYTTALNLANLLATNATSTNFNAVGLSFATANGSSITSTNAFFTTLGVTNFNPANINTTNATTTNLFANGSVNFTGATVSGLSSASLSDSATLARLASDQTFTGQNTFSNSTTLATTTIFGGLTLNNSNGSLQTPTVVLFNSSTASAKTEFFASMNVGDDNANRYVPISSQLVLNNTALNTISRYGTLSTIEVPASNTQNSNGSLRGVQSFVTHAGSGTLSSVNGVNAAIENKNAGTISTAVSLYAQTVNSDGGLIVDGVGNFGTVQNLSTGTIFSAESGYYSIVNNSTGQITKAVNISAMINNNNTSGLIVDAYGVSVGGPGYNWINAGKVSNSYGLYIDPSTNVGVTSSYAIYSGSLAKSYFAGGVGVGTTSTSSTLTVAGTAQITGTSTLATSTFSGFVAVGTTTLNENLTIDGDYFVSGHGIMGNRFTAGDLGVTASAARTLWISDRMTASGSDSLRVFNTYLPAAANGIVFGGEVLAKADASSTLNINELIGLAGYATNLGTTTVHKTWGLYGTGGNEGSGTVDQAYGIGGKAILSGTGDVLEGIGLLADFPNRTGSGNFGRYYGVGIKDLVGTATSASYAIYYQGSGDNAPFVVTASTTVGINTRNPQASLYIVTSNTAAFGITSSTSGQSLFHVSSGGNVGVGTSSPQAGLHVYNNTLLIDSPTSPTIIGRADIAEGPTVVAVSGKYAYVANNGSTMHVVDIANPTNPTIVGSIGGILVADGIFTSGKYVYVVNTGLNFEGTTMSVIDVSRPTNPRIVGTATGLYAPAAVYVSGRYAYVANEGNHDGTTMSVIDVSNPASPTVVGTANGLNAPAGIYVQGRFAYVTNGGNSTLSIVDITNPNNPLIVGTANGLSNPVGVHVSGKYAYVANFGNNSISIVDIASSTNPSVVSSVVDPNNTFGLWGIQVAGKYAYTTNVFGTTMTAVDISSSTKPKVTGVISNLEFPMGVAVTGKYAYVAGSSTLYVVDLKGADISVASIGSIATNDLSVSENVTIDNNLYVNNGVNVGIAGIYSLGAISIASSSNSALPLFSVFGTSTMQNIVPNASLTYDLGASTTRWNNLWVGTANIGTSTWSLTQDASGNFAIFDRPNATGTQRLNIAQNGQFTIAGTSTFATATFSGWVGIGTTSPQAGIHVVGNGVLVDTPNLGVVGAAGGFNAPYLVAVSGKYAYVANFFGANLSVVDISNPTLPVTVGSISGLNGAEGIYVSGKYVYLANYGGSNLLIIDVSSPTAPKLAGSAPGLSGPHGVYVSGKYAYVTNFIGNSLSVVDTSNPVAATTVGTIGGMTGNPRAVYVSGKYAYVGTNDFTNSIYIIDISNPAAPAIVGSVGGMFDIYSLRVSGRFAYATSNGDSTVYVVDISSSTAPVKKGQVYNGSNTFPRSIEVAGKYAYVSYYGGNFVSTIDITSSTAPKVVNTLSGLSGPRSIAVLGKYAYVTNYSNNTLTAIDLKGADISTANIGNIATNDLSVSENVTIDNNLYVNNGVNVGIAGIYSLGAISIASSSNSALPLFSVFGTSTMQNIVPNASLTYDLGASTTRWNNLWVGTANIGTSTWSLTQDANGSLVIFDHPNATGTQRLNIAQNGQFGISGTSTLATTTVARLGVGTATPQSGAHIYDNTLLVDNPVTPAVVGTVPNLNEPIGLAVSGKYAYVSNYAAGTMSIIDISDPSYPTAVGTASGLTNPQGVAVLGSYAYVVNDGIANSMSVINISKPSNPVIVGTLSGLNIPMSVYVSGKYAYISNAGGNNLVIADISNPLNPLIVNTVIVGSSPRYVYVSGKYAYVTNYSGNSMSIVDVSNVANAGVVGTQTGLNSPRGIYIAGKLAYVTNATGGGTLNIINISNPTSPVNIATTTGLTGAMFVSVAGKYAYVSNYTGNALGIIDISSSTNPVVISTTSLFPSPYVIVVSGKYAYTVDNTVGTGKFYVIDLKGADISSAKIGAVATNDLTVYANAEINNNLYVNNGLNVGPGGIYSQGVISIASTSAATTSLFSVVGGSSNFDGNITVAGISTLATTTITSTTITKANITNLVVGSCTGCGGGGGGDVYLANNQTFTGLNTFNLFTSFTTTTANSSTISFLNSASINSNNIINTGNLVNNNLLTVFGTSTFTTGTFSGYVGIGTTTPQAGLHLFDRNLLIDNPSNPKFIAAMPKVVPFENTYKISVAGNYAYVSAWNSGMHIVDISNPAFPKMVSAGVDSGAQVVSALVVGKYAYIGDGSGLAVYDVSSPKVPAKVSQSEIGLANYDTVISGNYFYGGDLSFIIGDISDPAHPTVVSESWSGTLYPSGIQIRNDYAFVTNNTNIDAFNVINIADKKRPVIVKSISGMVGPLGLALSGNFAYVADQSSLKVVDIASSTNPIIVGSVPLTQAVDIVVAGKYAYVSDWTDGIVIVDIASSTNPVVVSKTAVPGGAAVYGLTVAGNYLYVATSDGSYIYQLQGADMHAATIGSLATGDLTVADSGNVGGNLIVNGGLMVGVGGIASQGPVTIFPNTPSSTEPALRIQGGSLVVDNPTGPQIIGYTNHATKLNGAQSVFVSKKYAYVASFFNNSLSIVDVTNPLEPTTTNPVLVDSVRLNNPWAVQVAGKYAYVTGNSGNSLAVVDVSNPATATTTGYVVDAVQLNKPTGVAVSGKYAYVVSQNSNSLAVVDVSNPQTPTIVGSTSSTNMKGAVAVYVSGKYAYVAGTNANGLAIVDVSNPTAPTTTGFVSSTWMNTAYGVHVSGKYAYVVGSGSNSLAIVDISSSTAPTTTGYTVSTLFANPTSVYVFGKYAYVTGFTGKSLAIVDISSSTAPTTTGYVVDSAKLNNPASVFVAGKYAYVASVTGDSLSVIDIKGADISTANIGNIATNDLTVWENTDIGNNLSVRGGINVGVGGFYSSGAFSISATSSFYGWLGINTSSPLAAIHIASSTQGGNMRIDNGWLCVDNNGSCTGANTAGTIYATNGTVSGGADLAENYIASEELEPGDVVELDTTSPLTIHKTNTIYATNTLGIVSTKPGVLINGRVATNTYPVALAGRVPVKISLENGPISIGDKLASASVPGFAMKATADGTTVATALESYDSSSTSTTIMAFVHLGWNSAALNTALAPEINTATSTYLTTNTLLASIIEALRGIGVYLEQGVVRATEFVAGKITTNDLIANNVTTNEVTANKVCVGTVCVSQSELQQLLDKNQIFSTTSTPVTVVEVPTSTVPTSTPPVVEPPPIVVTTTTVEITVPSSTPEIIPPPAPTSTESVLTPPPVETPPPATTTPTP